MSNIKGSWIGSTRNEIIADAYSYALSVMERRKLDAELYIDKITDYIFSHVDSWYVMSKSEALFKLYHYINGLKDQKKINSEEDTLPLDRVSYYNVISVDAELLWSEFKSLKENEQLVLYNRFVIGLTQQETAKIVKCSKSRVGQIERVALCNLRNMLWYYYREYRRDEFSPILMN